MNPIERIGVAPLEEQVAAEHRGRERDAELEHVAPRPAPDEVRAEQHRRRQDEESDEGEADRDTRQGARRRIGVQPDRGCPIALGRRTTRSRRRHRPAGARRPGPRPGSAGGGRWRASPRGRRAPRSRARRRSRRSRTGSTTARPWSPSYAAAAPPGFGPAVVRTATARGTTLRTRPQFVHVSICADRPSEHIGQMTESSS